MPINAFVFGDVYKSTVKWTFEYANYRACIIHCFSYSNIWTIHSRRVLWLFGKQSIVLSFKKAKSARNSFCLTTDNDIKH
jgi:hypothetical protein